MFYGWEEFNGGASEPLMEASSKDAAIVAHLQRQLESTAAALQSEQARHAETIARNRELERELADRVHREHVLERRLQALEDAEERVVAQLADLEAEGLEQTRQFRGQIASHSQSLEAARSQVEFYRQRQVSLKELQAMDLAAQLLKSAHECDTLKEEVERVRSEATTELAVAKLVKAIQEEISSSVVPSKLLCRSECALRPTRQAAVLAV